MSDDWIVVARSVATGNFIPSIDQQGYIVSADSAEEAIRIFASTMINAALFRGEGVKLAAIHVSDLDFFHTARYPDSGYELDIRFTPLDSAMSAT